MEVESESLEYYININELTKDEIWELFDILIRYVYMSSYIDYVYVIEDDQKKKYFQRSNYWNENETVDYTEECLCYYDSGCDFNDTFETEEFIYYVLKSDHIDLDEIFNHYDNITRKIVSHIEHINKLNFRDIRLLCDKNIKFINIKGINHDHRGSNHTKLRLDFHDKFILDKQFGSIDFVDFADACFRIKSHKFDFWYEYYYNVRKIEMTDELIEIYVGFDHIS